jgi:hypothetical protein
MRFKPDKFQQWITLQEGADQHAENASAALSAIEPGKDRVVDRRLLQISRRESALSDFHESLAKGISFVEDENA